MMSKIEDALNKAKGIHKEKLRNDKSASEYSGNTSNVRSLVTNKSQSSIAARITSSREIALMKDDDLLDSKELSKRKIISSDMEDAKIANTYRDLRTKLLNKSNGKNFIAMVTSCSDDDSSSYVASNIATAFTFEETKTSLLIDCNLNSPRLHHILQKNIKNGLIDYLEDENLNIDSIMYTTGIKRLRLIPAGNPLEYCTNYRVCRCKDNCWIV